LNTGRWSRNATASTDENTECTDGDPVIAEQKRHSLTALTVQRDSLGQ